ncbi:MAG: YjbH domain-containing protein [Thermodesulfovibrionales bacterium]
MTYITRLFLFFLILFSFVVTPVLAGDEPFTGPASWGGTGLLTIPTARVIKENTYRVGFGWVDPYAYYYGTLSPFQGLEIDGRITSVRGVPAFPDGPSGYGDFKDKALDIKFQFMPEGKYMPAVAIGIMDPHGTRVYASQLIVASKQIYPFDFTLGFGNGRFGKKPLSPQGEGVRFEMVSAPREWLKDSQFFWGIQYKPSEKYAVMVEYSPIQYHKQTIDPARAKYFNDPVPSHYNFGLRWRPYSWTEFALSYQRGDTVGIGFSMDFELGRPLVPLYDVPYKEGLGSSLKPLSDRIAEALQAIGFSDIGVLLKDHELIIEAQNDTYYYAPKAVGRALRTLHVIAPDTVKHFHVLLRENGVPMTSFSMERIDVRDLFSEKLTTGEFLRLSEIRTDPSVRTETAGRYKKFFRYGVKPIAETLLNDPTGFFKYRIGAKAWGSYHPWTGASFIAGFEGFLLNNVSSSNEPLSIPVRSDLVLYKRQNVVLDRLMLDQIYKGGHELYGRVAAGLLEVQYAGIDGEVAMPLFKGRLLVGLGGSLVKKRDPDNPFALKSGDVKDTFSTAFVNARLNFPEKEFSVDIRGGKFLAGDKGVRVSVSKFINGVIISAWYSYTGTSIFQDSFNRGYNDKGVSVSIPLRLFKGSDSKTAYTYALSPWTRDVAQDIDHFNTLFDFIGRNQKIYIDKDARELTR